MKSHARVVVIGGGVTGCAILYHLAKMGWSDVVLLERKELTSGSSWHAAGNLFALTSPSNVSVLQKYTLELYPRLEEESEQACGYHPTGGLHFARNATEVEALKVMQSRGRRVGIESNFITQAEAKEMAPIVETSGLEGILHEPLRGHVDPASATNAYAKAARKLGATVYRHTPVIETNQTADGGWDVVTPEGTITADYVVNAAGLWAREVAALAGISLPLMPVEHHYLVTETIPEIAAMDHELPVITEAEAGYYSRQEGQGLLLGAYENVCHHWAVNGTPLDFDHELLPDDLERMEINFLKAVESMPPLGEAGIKRIINGPMIFSPDLGPLLGPYPGLKNYICACGVMTGFNQGGGIGREIAHWIIDGEPSLDIFSWDVTRFGDHADATYTKARTKYFYEHRTERHKPYQEFPAGRPAKTFPIYGRLKELGAVFGEAFGYEYPLWYARSGEAAEDHPSYRRTNWFDAVGEECRAVRDGVGLFEISTFAKYLVTGPGARDWLERLLANRMPKKIGRTVLSPMLSQKGKLIGDLTVTRLAEERFLLLGAGRMQLFHMRHFAKYLPAEGVSVENASEALAGMMIAGPKARALLSRLTDQDVSNQAFPFLSGRELALGPVENGMAVRVSFTGELGYELYVPMDQQSALFEALQEAGKDLGLRLAGSRALMSLRLEKGFASWGADLSPDYTPFDPGLDRFMRLDKEADFVGRGAALIQQQQGRREQLATFVIDVTDGADAFGGEAIFRDDSLVGYVTSGGYGHCVGESLALGYLKPAAWEDGAQYQVEILGERRPATLSAAARIDPEGQRMRG
ncbi:MAG: FAD-dependent oxidoreductase [Pseudomonadota bacterium]